MTQENFIRLMKEHADGKITLPQAKLALKGFVGAMREVMLTRDHLTLTNLGRFGLNIQGGQQVTNFHTGERYAMEYRYVPCFEPAPLFKKEVASLPCTKE